MTGVEFTCKCGATLPTMEAALTHMRDDHGWITWGPSE